MIFVGIFVVVPCPADAAGAGLQTTGAGATVTVSTCLELVPLLAQGQAAAAHRGGENKNTVAYPIDVQDMRIGPES
jgi:hypothetical protein